MGKATCSIPYEDGVPARVSFFFAALSGILLTFSFPKFELSMLAWFALVPLLVSAYTKKPRNSFFLGLFAGMVHYTGLMYWVTIAMHNYGHLSTGICIAVLFLLVFYLSFYVASFSYLVTRALSAGLNIVFAAPILWVSLEYLRSILLTGLPWENLAYSQYNVLTVIQISDILGNYGISFYIVMVNAIIADLICGPRLCSTKKNFYIVRFSILLVMSSIYWGYGFYTLNNIRQKQRSAPTMGVALVQGNIRQDVKWSPSWQKSTMDNYTFLSREATKGFSTDLLIWPETAVPFYFCDNSPASRAVEQLANELGANFLFGAPAYEVKNGNTLFYNSAYLVNKNSNTILRYDKVHLVPFGEYVPLRAALMFAFPFADKLVGPIGDFTPGARQKLLAVGPVRIGTLICFESIFPELARKHVSQGANLLVTITNDAWFGRSSAPYQHMSMAVFRAIENRVSLARAANTGISLFVLPTGEITQSTSLMTSGILKENLPLMSEQTVYNRIGDVLPFICLILSVVVIFYPIWRLKNHVD